MKPEPKMHTLIVERRPSHRANLKQAMNATAAFESVVTVPSAADALKRAKEGEYFNIVCISDRFERAVTLSLIESIRELHSGRDTVFILTVDATADGSTLTSGLIEGISGFLVSPYSVDGLSEVIQIARRVKRDNMEARIEKALGFYVEGLRTQLNELARHARHGRKAGISSKIFSEMCSALQGLEPELSDRYLERLVDSFTREIDHEEKAIARKAFSSASFRVRRNTAARAIERIIKAVA